jgi:acyl dehydratase
MPIDIEKLRAFPIPVGRQKLEPKDIALYALSIGLGADPLDEAQLRFVDPLQGPAVMPSMVLVMAHPGFWMADPRSGVDPKAVLHASQGFEIVGPLPQGEEIVSHTKIVGVVDKGEGKAALVDLETELSDGAGRAFARLTRTAFIRGGGGFGGADQAKAERAAPPEGPPDFVVELGTRPEQALIYRLNGDLNPLHSDPAIARKSGFERPLLHGLCTMGVVTHALVKALTRYRAERLRSMKLRFSRPVFPGETIRTEIWKDGCFRALVPARNETVVEDGHAICET